MIRAVWPPALVLALHAVASLGLRAYQRWEHLDEGMHLAGGFAIAVCFARSIEFLARGQPWLRVDARVTALLALAWTGTAAVAWELLEFLCDRWLATTSQGGVADTVGDLCMGLLGGLLYALARALRV